MRAGKRTLLAIVLASAVFSVQAQSVPKPKEFYFDEDRAAVPVVVVSGVQGDALVDQLVKARERGRKTVEATAQLAHVALSDGRADLGRQLYQQALASTQSGADCGVRSAGTTVGISIASANTRRPSSSGCR